MKRAQLLLSRAAKLFRRKPPEPPPAKQLSKAMSAGVAESRRVRDYDGALRLAMSELEKFQGVQSLERLDYRVRVHELVEARQMAGAGPWLVAESRAAINRPGRYREANPIISQGATGDIELALQNVEWRREVNLSWLEFSRWGIQQIILICRLYYLKHPWIRRGINLSAAYVFGQGVELSSPDPDANELLKSFREGNKMTLGQIALTECERRKSYDGNLFWAIFADKENTGEVQVRIIDATEIADIITNPEDSSQPWYYRRVWTQRTFDAASGSVGTTSREAW